MSDDMAQALTAQRTIPGASMKVIEGTGHLPFYENPAEFARIALDFLSPK